MGLPPTRGETRSMPEYIYNYTVIQLPEQRRRLAQRLAWQVGVP